MHAHVHSLPHMHAFKGEHSHTYANLKHREHKVKLSLKRVLSALLVFSKPWVQSPAWHKLGVVVHPYNPSAQEVDAGGF